MEDTGEDVDHERDRLGEAATTILDEDIAVGTPGSAPHECRDGAWINVPWMACGGAAALASGGDAVLGQRPPVHRGEHHVAALEGWC